MLKSYKTLINSTIAVAALAAALAACGGGGGGGAIPNPGGGNGGGGGGATPTPPPPPPASATGQMMLGGTALSNAQIVFTCGCSAQAGTVNADANGNYTISSTVNGFPAPNPQYTAVPGRNYVVVGAATSSHAESWTMIYYGNQPSHNLYISNNNVSDVYATAAALYVFFNSHNNNDVSFDDFNFNAIASFANSLRTAGMNGNNAAEAKLLADIVAEQNAGHTLFPSNPPWNPHAPSTSALISGDLTAVKNAGDAALPTPCPGGSGSCTGTPTP